MSRWAFVAAVVAAGACAACGSPDQPERIALRPVLPPEAAPLPAGPEGPWRALVEATPVREPEASRYFTAQKAPACPAIEVATALGSDMELKPGSRGFAEPGCVTLVVFWTVDTRQGKAAARHVSDLVHKYSQWRVRAVGIVERTARAEAAESFARQQGLAFSLYYDDLSALEDMADRADAEEERAVPAIFIIDRRMRLRFYRAGFRFAAGAFDERRPGEEIIWESAPRGHSVEDYLRTILSEG
ncbi:MAG: hypothetical protein AMK73_07100 [Planctomycetes bacterium SM23_32]|nr:MAG: hypothetical protein AMK73_07100 [Planctomycetes bacterium SM23_32]